MIKPNRNTLLLTINLAGMILLSVIWATGQVRAKISQVYSVPQLISYQGFLSDGEGIPVSGSKSMSFRIFSAEIGPGPLWEETHTGVEVNAGDFSVKLGGLSPFPEDLFDFPERWLEVEVEEVVLTPRQRFTSVPYALNADKIDGYDASELASGSLPSGAVVWFPDGSSPAGFAQLEGSLGEDIGPWEAIEPTLDTEFSCDVWTGSEVLCWDNAWETYNTPTGMRYDPVTDIWTPMSSTNAPEGRYGRSAVWTGTEMIVWGGQISALEVDFSNDGASYDPSSDTWEPISSFNAPVARRDHRAVWTGSEMIVWGGMGEIEIDLESGGRYNPVTNTWTSMTETGAPDGRTNHAQLWTGSKMIVYGGEGTQMDGALYDPSDNSWQTINPVGAAGLQEKEWFPTAAWTGTEMVFPYADYLYFYNPSLNSWRHRLNFQIKPYIDREGAAAIENGMGGPIIIAGNYLITQGSVFDLSQGKAVARNPGVSWTRAFWLGDRLLFLNEPWDPLPITGSIHTIELILPYGKE